MWQRFSAARNSFDRARRVWFAQLDTQQSEAKATKTRLVADAERLSTSKDWAPTAGAFKRLMDEWRRAGRAGRQDDDALWARFRAAQDAFFTARHAASAVEDEEYAQNLVVKEALLTEAEGIDGAVLAAALASASTAASCSRCSPRSTGCAPRPCTSPACSCWRPRCSSPTRCG